MKLFKIAVKFEQDCKWSDREADTEGYLVQEDDEEGSVYGYVNTLYPTQFNSTKFICGIKSGKSLSFIQMNKEPCLSPICYAFLDTSKEGFWSNYSFSLGFFPVEPGEKCSNGHARITIQEVTGEGLEDAFKKTNEIFERLSQKPSFINSCMMVDYLSVKDFLDESTFLQMELHCGKW